MGVSQSLTLTETYVWQSTNESVVRILWRSTQSGASWNGYPKTAKYYISINGGAEKELTVGYSLPQNSTVAILDSSIKVPHKDDGTGTIAVRTWMDTGISAGVITQSQSLDLTTIPRETSLDSVACNTSYFNGQITLKYTPKSASFYNRYHVDLYVEGKGYIEVRKGDLGQVSASQNPHDFQFSSAELSTIYTNLPNTRYGKLRFTMRTYEDVYKTKEVGDGEAREITLYVPNSTDTQPTATMTVSPVSSLPSPFDTLYIKGKTKVTANLTNGAGKYGASIVSYTVSVEGKGGKAPYTSGYLTTPGDVVITGTVTDSRGHSRVYTETINVLDYSAPQIVHISSESEVVAARCDSLGNLSDTGTYLKIKAKRSYTKTVTSNLCSIRYRCKKEGGNYPDDWITILATTATSDEVVTGALLGNLSVDSTYAVQVQAIDSIGETGTTTIIVPTEKVYWHKAGHLGSFAFGKYAEDKDTIDIAEHITTKVRGPASFSGGVTIQDDAVADFIVEQGTNGIWTYRKWHSGIAECWGLYPVSDANISIAWGSLYESGQLYQASFPSGLFVDVPVFTMNVQESTAGILSLETVNSTTKDATCYIYPTRATTGTVSFKIAMRAIGRWK